MNGTEQHVGSSFWKWCELKEQRFCKSKTLLRVVRHTAQSPRSQRLPWFTGTTAWDFSLPSCLLTYLIHSGNLLSFHFLLKSTTKTENFLAQKLQGSAVCLPVMRLIWTIQGLCEDDLLQYVAKFLFLITCPCVFTRNVFNIYFFIFCLYMGEI